MKGVNLLIVEDDADFRETFLQVFLAHGAKAQSAPNGEVAFELIQKNAFDVVISDVQMPGGNGIELMKKIAKLPHPKPLCFLCTGHFDRFDLSLEELDLIKIYEKPVQSTKMIAELREFLRARDAA